MEKEKEEKKIKRKKQKSPTQFPVFRCIWMDLWTFLVLLLVVGVGFSAILPYEAVDGDRSTLVSTIAAAPVTEHGESIRSSSLWLTHCLCRLRFSHGLVSSDSIVPRRRRLSAPLLQTLPIPVASENRKLRRTFTFLLFIFFSSVSFFPTF